MSSFLLIKGLKMLHSCMMIKAIFVINGQNLSLFRGIHLNKTHKKGRAK
jgi:hypothetical protein